MNIDDIFYKLTELKGDIKMTMTQFKYDKLLLEEKLAFLDESIKDLIDIAQTKGNLGKKRYMTINGHKQEFPSKLLGLYHNIMIEKAKVTRILTSPTKEALNTPKTAYEEELTEMVERLGRIDNIIPKRNYRHDIHENRDLKVKYALLPMLSQKKVTVVSAGEELDSSEDLTLYDETSVYTSENRRGWAKVKYSDGEETEVFLQVRRMFGIRLTAFALGLSLLFIAGRSCHDIINNADLGELPVDESGIHQPGEYPPEDDIIDPTPTPDLDNNQEDDLDNNDELLDPSEDLEADDELTDSEDTNKDQTTRPNQQRPGDNSQTDPKPDPTPDPTPDPKPDPTPEPTPDPKPDPTPEPPVIPTPNPDPSPEPPTPQPPVVPTPNPEPTPQPPTPQPPVVPTPNPDPSPQPQTPQPPQTPNPNPNPEPTNSPLPQLPTIPEVNPNPEPEIYNASMASIMGLMDGSISGFGSSSSSTEQDDVMKLTKEYKG